MGLLKTKQGRLERFHIGDLSDDYAFTGGSTVSEQIDYLDGNYKVHIMQGLINRYARKITKDANSSNAGDGVWEDGTYIAALQYAPKAAIEAGLFEVVGTEYYQKIARHAGSLANNTQFVYVDGDSDKPNEEFAADMAEEREKAGFNQRLGRAEEMAVATGSAGILVQVVGSKLDYQPLPSNQIWIAFNATIIDDGEERPVNMMDINEASVVVVLVEAGNETNTYAAFFPRSDEYPQGRMVKYDAAKWYNIPMPGFDSYAVEALDNAGEIGNPLTVLQDKAGDYSIPEIPVIPWVGTLKGVGKSILPTDTALFDTCKELDMSLSRAFTSLNKSATGNLMFTSEAGSSPVWADNLGEGVNMLKPGQSAIMLNLPPAGGESLLNAVERGGAMVGDSYGVPDYLLAVGDSANVPSGAALMELNQPSAKMRRMRADANRGNMRMLFAVEKALAAIDNDDPSFAAGIEQRWIVNDMSIVKTDEQRLNEAKMAQDLRVKGQRENVRDLVHGMADATDDEVDAYIADLKMSAAQATPTLGRFTAAAGQAQRA